MNEITKIHLGRQAFTIAIDAHKALQEYLHAIKRQTGGKDVAEEVELRMAELLLERGVRGDKVILLKDVDFLKEQLGQPDDFGDEGSDKVLEGTTGQKRLFRDTENGMLAGVCAGIAKYVGTDPVWIRLIFVALLFAGFSGILLYIILWLIVPEAKTNSDRLQMQGKPVNVDTLKEVVERADVKGAAQRAQHTVEKVVHGGLKGLLAIIGVTLMVGAIATLLGLTTASIYWLLNPDIVPADLFPVGASEIVLIVSAILFAALLAGFLLLAGLAMVKRKWPLPAWAAGVMGIVWLASLAVGGALTADTVPKVRDRYEAAQHIYTVPLAEFNKLQIIGSHETSIKYEESADRSISIRYWGKVDLSRMKTAVKDQTLTVDAESIASSMRCKAFCVFHPPILEVTVKGPKLQEVTTETPGIQLKLPNLQNQTLKVRAKGSSIYLPNIASDAVKAERTLDGSWIFTLGGLHRGTSVPQEISVFDQTATIAATNIDLKFAGQCDITAEGFTGERIFIYGPFEKLTVNGVTVGQLKDLLATLERPGPSAEKCIYAEQPGVNPDTYYWKDAVNDSL